MSRRRGFTLVELLVTILIIGILASLFLGALGYSAEAAREARTKSMIAKLDAAISMRWESYRTRRFPTPTTIDPTDSTLRYTPTVNYVSSRFGYNWSNAATPIPPLEMNRLMLDVRRELQRMELPARWEDITMPVVPGINRPAVSQAYLNRYNANTPPNQTVYPPVAIPPTPRFEGAECLYLIITVGAVDEDANPLDHFRSFEVGDIDQDGAPEILDGWNNPITWYRWCPALSRTFYFTDSNGNIVQEFMPSDIQRDPAAPDAATFSRQNHDPFDTGILDLPFETTTITTPPKQWVATASDTIKPRGYRLWPLIVSAGPDGGYGIRHRHYSDVTPNGSTVTMNLIDPYDWPEVDDNYGPDGSPLGPNIFDTENPYAGPLDNITNHNLQVR